MADAYWMQLGANLVFALEVGGRIVGIVYWLDTGGFEDAQAAESPLPETGWYFLSTNLPRNPERVAQGLELTRDMTEEQLGQTVERALEAVTDEVLAGGGEE